MKNAVIVLPTYNERDNIRRLLEQIQHQRLNLPRTNLSVLVVDDSSPDGTAEIVRNFTRYDSRIHLLEGGKKEGLGAAYIRGFKYALENLKADILLEMDADLSHDPNDIPRFVQAIEAGNDFVIGSRYIDGGTIPVDWSVLRRLNSKFGNILARYIAGLGKINDCTSGFRAMSKTSVIKVDLRTLETKGYSFQIGLLSKIVQNGDSTTEIPIHFKNRTQGVSKISFADIIEFIYVVLRLRKEILLTSAQQYFKENKSFSSFIRYSLNQEIS